MTIKIARRCNCYNLDEDQIEKAIRMNLIEMAASHIMPLPDLRTIEIKRKVSLIGATSVTIYTSCKKITGGDNELTSIVVEQGANVMDMENALIIAKCIVTKPNS